MGPAALCWACRGGKCEVSRSPGGEGDGGHFQGGVVHAVAVLGFAVEDEAYPRPHSTPPPRASPCPWAACCWSSMAPQLPCGVPVDPVCGQFLPLLANSVVSPSRTGGRGGLGRSTQKASVEGLPSASSLVCFRVRFRPTIRVVHVCLQPFRLLKTTVASLLKMTESNSRKQCKQAA